MSGYDLAPVTAEIERLLGAHPHSAVQLSAALHGETIADLAIGDSGSGQPINTGSLFSIYCAGKPLTALAMACLVEDGEVSFNDRLGHVIDEELASNDALRVLPLHDLMSHSCTFHEESGVGWGLLTPVERYINVSQLSVDRSRGSYSSYAAWYLLGLAVERLSGLSLADLVRTRLLEPLGIAADVFIGMSPAEHAANAERVAVTVDGRGPAPIPLLMESARSWCCQWNPAFGAIASMRGLCQIYSEMLHTLDGNSSVGISQRTAALLVNTYRSPTFDDTLARVCGFGLGFMSNLQDHRFGPVSERAFGHSGNAGGTFAFADPDHGLAMAATCSSLLESEESVGERRPALVRAVYDALVASSASGQSRPSRRHSGVPRDERLLGDLL